MEVAVALGLGILLAVGIALAYYLKDVKAAEKRVDEAEAATAAAERTRNARDQERYERALEEAKNAKVPDALRAWRSAHDRMHKDGDGR